MACIKCGKQSRKLDKKHNRRRTSIYCNDCTKKMAAKKAVEWSKRNPDYEKWHCKRIIHNGRIISLRKEKDRLLMRLNAINHEIYVMTNILEGKP